MTGMATSTPGVCDCGFRHYYNGTEVDFCISADRGSLFVGWNWRDDIFSVCVCLVVRYFLRCVYDC